VLGDLRCRDTGRCWDVSQICLGKVIKEIKERPHAPGNCGLVPLFAFATFVLFFSYLFFYIPL
jgi:hypothetical protein